MPNLIRHRTCKVCGAKEEISWQGMQHACNKQHHHAAQQYINYEERVIFLGDCFRGYSKYIEYFIMRDVVNREKAPLMRSINKQCINHGKIIGGQL
jgi:hypothetical protein